MKINLLPVCPNFAAHPIVYKHKAGMWECLECEVRFNGAAPQVSPADNSQLLASKTTNQKIIFFSYGHDDNQELVDRFKTDLEKRGHTVWIDYKEIGNWSDWKGKITQGIHDSDLALAFLSKHATRDPGVCSNEIAMALNRFGTVYPILLESANEVSPPVTISHLQWQDLSLWRDIRDGKCEGKDWGRWYEEKLIQIITLLEGEASEFEGDIKSLREVLKPVSFTSDIARHIPEFVGREWVFDAYQNWLGNQPQSRLFWIKAGPGVGKTAIAAMLAHTRQSAIVGAWFCQANSIERRDTRKALCSLAFQLASRWDDYRRKLRFQLGFNASTQPDDWKNLRDELLKKNEADLFDFLFSEPLTGLIWRDHRLVVVIDALDEASDCNANNPLVDLLVTRLAHLPTWLNFVITSRPNQEIVAKLQGFAPFELDTEDPRNRDDLNAYLETCLVRRADFSDLPEVEQTRIKTILLDNSQGMILYLQQVLKGMEEGVINLETIEQIPRGLGSLYRIAFDHHYGGDKLQSIYDDEVKPLLRLLLAAPEPLPPALTQQVLGWNKETYLRRRNRLGAYVIDTPQGCKLFHKTLQEWLGDEISTPYYIDTQTGKQALAEYLWQSFDSAEDGYKLEWPHQSQHWLPDLMSLLPQWEDAAALNALGNYLSTFAQYKEAEALLRRGLLIRENTLGFDHPSTAASLSNLAGLLQNQGDFADAESLCRRALAIRERVLGVEHPDTATSLNNLASLLASRGDYAGAEPLHHRALAIRENILGAEHPSTGGSLNNLALLLREKGDYSGAEALCRRSLAIVEKFRSPMHCDTAVTLNNLALNLQALGDYDGAEPLQRRALAIFEKTLGSDHPSIAIGLGNLAVSLESRGDSVGAEPLYRRALAISEKSLGAEHPDTACSLNNLGQWLKSQCDYASAEPLCRRALAIREKVLGSEHPDTATSLNNLAILLETKSDYVGAEPLYRRALAIRENIYGKKSSQVGSNLYSLGCVLWKMGQNDEAEELLRRELEISLEQSGDESEGSLCSMNTLAELLEEQEDINASTAVRFKQLNILEKTAGNEHDRTLTVLQNLAVLLRNSGIIEKAEPLQREAVTRFINVHGENGLDTASAYSALGALLKLKGEFEEAETYYLKALAIRERELGVDSEPTKLVRQRLAELIDGMQ